MPKGYVGQGTRRFVENLIPFRIATSTFPTFETFRVNARKAVARFNAKFQPTISLVEVQSGERVLFRQGTSYQVEDFGPGGIGPTITVDLNQGGASPFKLAADRVTLLYAEVVQHPTEGTGEGVIFHELEWHHFFSLLHCKNLPTGICRQGGFGDLNAQPFPGFDEGVKWIYTVPAGSRPQR